jgi:hypothetical protein
MAEGSVTASFGDIRPFYGDIRPFYGDIRPFAGAATASYGDIRPFYGDIRPFYGDIRPFYGDIRPFAGAATASYGDIRPFYGDIRPFFGDIRPFYGDIRPFYGDIRPFKGDVSASFGDIRPFYGDIRPFFGDIRPFYGDIRPFFGDIRPFYGDIRPFFGDIRPFEGDVSASYGDIRPFYGDIRPFFGDIRPFYGDIRPFFGDIRPFQGDVLAAGGDVAASFTQMLANSETMWGASILAQTGQSFWDGFGAGILNKYGLNRTSLDAFTGLSELDRLSFLFDWSDGLMQFSGADQSDYWMGLTGWSPTINWFAADGTGSTIGIVDFKLTGAADLGDRLVSSGGYDLALNSHGNAVAGILAGAHDGRGVMGIAPGAAIASYNPFDETKTAGWVDIGLGIQSVLKDGANVVNLSLGISDLAFSPEWADVYAGAALSATGRNAIFVHAAGNEGASQKQNIAWTSDIGLTNLLVVGSIGPNGEISSFSNTPGSACFVTSGDCQPQNMLKNRYLVAPGEWVLVSDGAGGVSRMSGTSFAAPMVSGAVALLQDRWGWLKLHPSETAQILLTTATDLGAQGVDEVYGHGLLNIAASQSPIHLDQLYQLSPGKNGAAIRSGLAFAVPNQKTMWGAGDARLSIYEDIGSTFRDFNVPLNMALVGTNAPRTTTEDDLGAYMQDGFAGWVGTDTQSVRLISGKQAGSWDMTLKAAPLPYGTRVRDQDLNIAMDVSMSFASGVDLQVGRGYGAQALNGGAANASGRLDATMSGVNPIISFASGGMYARAGTPVGSGSFNFGVTQRTYEPIYFLPFSDEQRAVYRDLDAYKATAASMSYSQPVASALSMSAGYSYLRETNGVLGVQSLVKGSFQSAAETDALTMGATYQLSDRMQLSGSATVARTRGQAAGRQLLSVDEDGLVSTSFEAALEFADVRRSGDRLRLALTQPLHIDNGDLTFTGINVLDRSIGALGMSSTTLDIANQARRVAVEAYYAAPVMNGAAEVAGFVRVTPDRSNQTSARDASMIGASFSLDF